MLKSSVSASGRLGDQNVCETPVQITTNNGYSFFFRFLQNPIFEKNEKNRPQL